MTQGLSGEPSGKEILGQMLHRIPLRQRFNPEVESFKSGNLSVEPGQIGANQHN